MSIESQQSSESLVQQAALPLLRLAVAPERSATTMDGYLADIGERLVKRGSEYAARAVFAEWKDSYASTSLPSEASGSLLERDDDSQNELYDLELRRAFIIDVIIFLGLGPHSNLDPKGRVELIDYAALAFAAVCGDKVVNGVIDERVRRSLHRMLHDEHLKELVDATAVTNRGDRGAVVTAYRSARQFNDCMDLLVDAKVVTPMEAVRTKFSGVDF